MCLDFLGCLQLLAEAVEGGVGEKATKGRIGSIKSEEYHKLKGLSICRKAYVDGCTITAVDFTGTFALIKLNL